MPDEELKTQEQVTPESVIIANMKKQDEKIDKIAQAVEKVCKYNEALLSTDAGAEVVKNPEDVKKEKKERKKALWEKIKGGLRV